MLWRVAASSEKPRMSGHYPPLLLLFLNLLDQVGWISLVGHENEMCSW